MLVVHKLSTGQNGWYEAIPPDLDLDDGLGRDRRVRPGLGLIVDGVDDILTVTEESIADTTQIVAGVGNEYIRGIVKLEDRLVILLDINRAL